MDNGERVLAAKAPYELGYVAAAIALLCGWFAKGNGTPNPTVAAAKLRSPGATAPSTKATASVKAWMERLRQLDAATRAQAKRTIITFAERRTRQKRSRY